MKSKSDDQIEKSLKTTLDASLVWGTDGEIPFYVFRKGESLEEYNDRVSERIGGKYYEDYLNRKEEVRRLFEEFEILQKRNNRLLKSIEKLPIKPENFEKIESVLEQTRANRKEQDKVLRQIRRVGARSYSLENLLDLLLSYFLPYILPVLLLLMFVYLWTDDFDSWLRPFGRSLAEVASDYYPVIIKALLSYLLKRIFKYRFWR